jgi:hypothetical protein
MTVEREEPGILFAVCDRCGERCELEHEPGEETEEIDEAALLAEIGWKRNPPDKVKFHDSWSGDKVHRFANDLCPDCQAGETRPAPRFGSGRVVPRHVEAANDPCDEWPRALVFEAAGLRRDCGHPKGVVGECGYCRAGYPIGSMRPSWRRA